MEQSTLERTCRAADHGTLVEVLTVWPDHRSAFVHEVPGHFCAERWDALTAQEDTIQRAADVVSVAPIRSVGSHTR